MSAARPVRACSEGRAIPAAKRLALRVEVNFGCPVLGCGNPYLTYHHFDPPFHVGKAHSLEGMIALCLAHHKQADAGTWPDDRLRAMKKAPFLTGEAVQGRLEWLRRDVMIYAGNNLALNPGVLLQVDGQKVIWTRRDVNGDMYMNIHVQGDDGGDLLRLEDNDWIVTGPIADLRASASANSIRVAAPARGVTLDVQFSNLPESTVRAALQRQAEVRAGQPSVPPELAAILPPALLASMPPRTAAEVFEEMWEPYAKSGIRWPAMYAAISGRFRHPIPIRLTPTKLTLPRGRAMSGNLFMVRGATLIDVVL
jgi:hypothetical protein